VEVEKRSFAGGVVFLSLSLLLRKIQLPRQREPRTLLVPDLTQAYNILKAVML